MKTLFFLFISSLSFANCTPAFEKLQKKILVDYIYKYTFNFGDEIQVRNVRTLNCSEKNLSQYLVTYRDLLCQDLHDPERETYKCHEVLCQSVGSVSAEGTVDFDLAPESRCRPL